jgi:hypothetical protein
MATNTMIDGYGRTTEERRALQDKVKRANEMAALNWDDPTWRREMAQELTETIYLGFEHENLLMYMTQVENADFNARVFLKEVKGLRAFWVARGGYIEASTVRAEVLEIPRDTIGFHVYEFEDKLRTNFAETQATLVELGIQRLDAEVNLRMFSLLQASVPAGSPSYIATAGVSLPVLNTAIRQVRDESRDQEVVIVGRSLQTDQILDAIQGGGLSTGPGGFGGFLPETNEDLLRRGVLGTYRGAKIISLKNYRDDTDTPFFPGNELWVIARDASKFAFWGGLLSKEYTEDDNWYWHYLARRDFGGVVHRPSRLRRLIDTTTPAYTIVPQ